MSSKKGLEIKDKKILKEGALAWRKAKDVEAAATEARRVIEDYIMAEVISLAQDFEGSQTRTLDDVVFKVTGRMNRKVDGDMLEALAQEHGLTKVIEDLFKWKPDVKMKEWKQADESITSLLAQAITTTPGRPSFDITIKEALNG